MSIADTPALSPPPDTSVPSPAKALRGLFLTLFLRGRGSRGLQRKGAPTSIGKKLGLTLCFYAAVGFLAFIFMNQSVFALSVYLHGMTFVFLGMFVASSAGEILFNNQEADILLHRPVSARTLLWAKVRVLVEVSLWMAGAFNLAGLFVGIAVVNGGWRFPFVHAGSTILEALFCTGCVIMTYQLCLRWFGRERLDGLMTTAQVLVSIAAVLGGQLLPQFVFRFNHVATFDAKTWWIALLPPAWFAGLDDALAGSGAESSWVLAAVSLVATTAVLWIAFGKLAGDYGAGLQRLGETTGPRPGKRSCRWIERLIDLPPLSWWLRDSVARAAFLLTTAYLLRDRDVKLRIYPAMAPYLVLPVILLMRDHGPNDPEASGFTFAFLAAFLGMIPMMGLGLMQYSQQWQAADIFRAAPILGPASLCDGARRAILCLLALPGAIIIGLLVWFSHGQTSQILMLLPGLIAMPIYALIPTLGGGAVPLSLPTEEAKSAGRGLTMMWAMMSSMVLSGMALLSQWAGWFWWFIAVEMIVAVGLYIIIRRSVRGVRWSSME